MAQVVIDVQDLSKSYLLNHENRKDKSRSIRKQVSGFLSTINKKNKVTTEEFWALKNINIQISQGDRVGILGRNGAGKSTLLKIISRITQPTAGSLTIRGKVISMLELGTGFHPELSGRENIYLNGSILGMSRKDIRSRFDQIVDFAEIENFLDTPVKKYSSGMHMRLAFSVSAHLEPEILIVDEVLAVGDARFQKKCMAKMNEISRSNGITILFVSHNITAVSSFCTTGLYLKDGQVKAYGDIDTVSRLYGVQNMASIRFTPNKHREIYFKSLELADSIIKFGEEIVLQLTIVSTMQVKEYVLGIVISDYFENKVGTTLMAGKSGLNYGDNQVRLSIMAGNIVPGNYKFTVSIALDDSLDNIDVVLDYPTFNIVEKNIPVFNQWHQSWGGNLLEKSEFIPVKATI